MSAGTASGILEYNHYKDKETNFINMGVSKKKGIFSLIRSKSFSPEERINRLQTVVATG